MAHKKKAHSKKMMEHEHHDEHHLHHEKHKKEHESKHHKKAMPGHKMASHRGK